MKIKITFHGMNHSALLENHCKQKLVKISDILHFDETVTPFHVEIWLNAHKKHLHHSAEIHLKTPQFELIAKNDGQDMYLVIDSVIDKMVTLIKKEKTKKKDKKLKSKTEKKDFIDDKYTLSEE